MSDKCLSMQERGLAMSPIGHHGKAVPRRRPTTPRVRTLGAESSPPTLSPALPSGPDPLLSSHQGPEKQVDLPSHKPESMDLEPGILTLCPGLCPEYLPPGTNGPDLPTSSFLNIAIRWPVPALSSSPGCVTLE